MSSLAVNQNAVAKVSELSRHVHVLTVVASVKLGPLVEFELGFHDISDYLADGILKGEFLLWLLRTVLLDVARLETVLASALVRIRAKIKTMTEIGALVAGLFGTVSLSVAMLFTELANSSKHCRLSAIPPKMTNLTAVVALGFQNWLGTITLVGRLAHHDGLLRASCGNVLQRSDQPAWLHHDSRAQRAR